MALHKKMLLSMLTTGVVLALAFSPLRVNASGTEQAAAATAATEAPAETEAKKADLLEVHKLYSPVIGDFIYTSDVAEKDYLSANGWSYKGVAWYAPSTGTTPVWRMINLLNFRHYYTASDEEREQLEAAGWRTEGAAFFSDETKRLPIYRQSNAQVAAVNGDYTTDVTGNTLAWYAAESVPAPQYPEAEAILNQIGWDLKAAFNYSCMKWVKSPTDPSLGTHYYATVGYTRHTGNCYVMAGTFCELAKALGYNAVQITGVVPLRRGGLGPHSWVEIDGKVYDPDYQVESRRSGFAIWYGKSGTWVYTKKGIVE